MKCLSLWQPWSSLLVAGIKCVETRSWRIRHRGPLLIHAAKKWDGEIEAIALSEPFKSALLLIGMRVPYRHSSGTGHEHISKPGELPFGAIIGRVDVVECYETEKALVTDADGADPVFAAGQTILINERERAFGDYGPGRFAFLCRNAVRFETPIPFRGMQGLFDVPYETIVESVAP